MKQLYNLKENLKNCVIAGINIIDQDFRLKNSIEEIEKISNLSPVFKKLYEMLCNLLNNTENREAIFFEINSLLNAVLTTQATNINIENIENLTTYKLNIQNNSYNEIEEITNLLTTKKTGKTEEIKQLIKINKNLIYDYRIINFIVELLNSKHNELALFIKYYLTKYDNIGIVDLLKNDFNINNKRDMIYKVEIIRKIAKEQENDFYLYLFDNAKKDLLQEVIKALGYNKENKEILIKLYNKKNYKFKDEVIYSLANIEDEEIKQIIKNVIKLDENYIQNKENIYKFLYLFQDIKNNMLDEVYTELLETLVNKNITFNNDLILSLITSNNIELIKTFIFKYIHIEDCHINIVLSELLVYNIIKSDDNKFLNLAKEIIKKDKYNYYKTTVFLISLLTKPAKEVFEKFSKEVFPDKSVKLKNNNGIYNKQLQNLQRLFFSICLNKEDKNIILIKHSNNLENYKKSYEKNFSKQLYENLHIDWFKQLYDEEKVLLYLNHKGHFYQYERPSYYVFYDETEIKVCVINFILNNYSETYTLLHNDINKYLMKTNRYMYVNTFLYSLNILQQCGVTDFSKLVRKFLINDILNASQFFMFSMHHYRVLQYMTKQDLIKELKEVRELIKANECNKQGQNKALENFDKNFSYFKIV